jgi:hypothetical protein
LSAQSSQPLQFRALRPIARNVDRRLQEDAIVTVSLPSNARGFRVIDFRATVIALIESGVVLHPIELAGALPPGHAEDVFLSFVSAAGQLVGLKGTLISDDRGVRFEVRDGVHVRRRRYTRVDAQLPVTLDGCPGTTVNVAPDGLLVEAPLTVELGQDLELELTLPAYAQPLRLGATVVRHAGGLIALNFHPARRDARAAIAEFVVERRAAELQPTPST